MPASSLRRPPARHHSNALRYVADTRPGIARSPAGPSGFRFKTAAGKIITDEPTLQRIRKLAIPPAWTDVWISPQPNGHIQATGRDVRGRKQYRYHQAWREAQDKTKYERTIAFARALPRIRHRVERDLRRRKLDRSKVLAAVVRLLETTLIRVGNEEYARENGSFGLSTMRDRHAKIRGDLIHFDFRGKSGIHHVIDLHDARLARVVRESQELPGQILFQYRDESGHRQRVKSQDVNLYLREVAGENFSAKDFRTWSGTLLAAIALHEFERFDSATQAKKNVVQAIESVAKKLGNTPTICRKCYVHPAVLEAYFRGETIKVLHRKAARALSHVAQLTPQEAVVLAFLERQLAQKKGKQQAALKR